MSSGVWSGSSWTTLNYQFYAVDHLGSTRLVTDVSSNLVQGLKYWPYGDDAPGSGSDAGQRLKFAGMERDTENRHYFDHARTQDFNLGRFVSADELFGDQETPQSWNRYSYVMNNPTSLSDPSGLTTCEIDDSGQMRCSESIGVGGAKDPFSNYPFWGPIGGWVPSSAPTFSGSVARSVNNEVRHAPEQTFGACVAESAKYFSLQHAVQAASGGQFGNGFVSEALLGSEVAAGIDLLGIFSGNDGEAMRAAGGIAFSHGAETAADALAPRIPNLAASFAASASFVLETPVATYGLRIGGQVTAAIPLGAAARSGAAAFGLFNALKLPYDLAVGAFASVLCGIGR